MQEWGEADIEMRCEWFAPLCQVLARLRKTQSTRRAQSEAPQVKAKGEHELNASPPSSHTTGRARRGRRARSEADLSSVKPEEGGHAEEGGHDLRRLTSRQRAGPNCSRQGKA